MRFGNFHPSSVENWLHRHHSTCWNNPRHQLFIFIKCWGFFISVFFSIWNSSPAFLWMFKECQCHLWALEHESIVSAFSFFLSPYANITNQRVLEVSQWSLEYFLSHIMLSQEPVLVFGGVNTSNGCSSWRRCYSSFSVTFSGLPRCLPREWLVPGH